MIWPGNNSFQFTIDHYEQHQTTAAQQEQTSLRQRLSKSMTNSNQLRTTKAWQSNRNHMKWSLIGQCEHQQLSSQDNQQKSIHVQTLNRLHKLSPSLTTHSLSSQWVCNRTWARCFADSETSVTKAGRQEGMDSKMDAGSNTTFLS